ncbi:MAG: hypothetical protein Q8Q11_03250 [bacterium]|nr:hypothetical protein [bacterium]
MAENKSNPDKTGGSHSDSARERQELFDAVPEAQQEQIRQTDYEDAMMLMGQAENLYVDSELEKLRDTMERAERHGVEWDEAGTEEMNRRTTENLADNVPKEFIKQAEADLHRTEQVTGAIESRVAEEPEDAQSALRDRADRWAKFLELRDKTTRPAERSEQSTEYAKDFEQALAESPLSKEFKERLRDDELLFVVERAKSKSRGRVPDDTTLENARQWLLKMVRAEDLKPEPKEPIVDEVWDYTKSRLQRWSKALFGNRKRMAAAAVLGFGALVLPPVGAAVGFGIGIAVLVEGSRAAIHGTARGLERGSERVARSSRERRIRGLRS